MRFVAMWSLLLALSARADVTVRYSTTLEPGSAVPPQAVEQMKAQMGKMFGESVQQIKGNRARNLAMGLTSVTDFEGAIVTLIDEKTKRYASASQQHYLRVWKEKMPKAPEDPPKPDAQIESSTSKTGRTRVVHGIEAEETEHSMTIQVPGVPMRMRAVMSFWTPAPSDKEKHPALVELSAYAKRAGDGTDVASSIKSLMGSMRGLDTTVTTLVERLKDAGLVLEMNISLAMPGMREMLAKMSPEKSAALPAGGDDVLLRVTQKLVELSTAELPDSLFVVPRDYTAVDLSEMVEQSMRTLQRPAKQ